MENKINRIIAFLGILLIIFGWLGTQTFLGNWSWAIIILGIISILKGFFAKSEIVEDDEKIEENTEEIQEPIIEQLDEEEIKCP